jgi:hypothetical protein
MEVHLLASHWGNEERHAPSFALRFEQSKYVLYTDGALDVPDDRAGALVHELDTDLGDSSSRSSAAENLCIQKGLCISTLVSRIETVQ